MTSNANSTYFEWVCWCNMKVWSLFLIFVRALVHHFMQQKHVSTNEHLYFPRKKTLVPLQTSTGMFSSSNFFVFCYLLMILVRRKHTSNFDETWQYSLWKKLALTPWNKHTTTMLWIWIFQTQLILVFESNKDNKCFLYAEWH